MIVLTEEVSVLYSALLFTGAGSPTNPQPNPEDYGWGTIKLPAWGVDPWVLVAIRPVQDGLWLAYWKERGHGWRMPAVLRQGWYTAVGLIAVE